MTLKQLIDFDILSFNRICEKIANGEHFSLARYGDGEFNAILGKDGANCDGHEYFPEMGADLAATLASDPPYFIGLHQSARIQEETLQWLKNARIVKDNGDGTYWQKRQFVANAVFHDAVRDGKMRELWKALKQQVYPCVIAPDYICDELDGMIQDATDVDFGFRMRVPAKNTYSSLDAMKRMIDKVDFENDVVLICASMTAPLIVDYLYKQYGDTATFIDFGSSFDPYVGVKSRSFHKNITP